MPLITKPQYSTLADDPDLGDLVDQFVCELPERTQLLERGVESGDWEQVRRVAHQLRGALGSYGFHALSQLAGRVDTLLATRADSGRVMQAIEELLGGCRFARTGSAALTA